MFVPPKWEEVPYAEVMMEGMPISEARFKQYSPRTELPDVLRQAMGTSKHRNSGQTGPSQSQKWQWAGDKLLLANVNRSARHAYYKSIVEIMNRQKG